MKTVLIADDDPDILRLVEAHLKPAGITSRFAETGEAAVRLAGAIRPALLLLDIHLPDMNGFEVIARLQYKDETRRIPVLMLSAASSAPNVMQARRLGVTDFIVKPFSPDILVAKIRAVLERSEADHATADANPADLLRNKTVLVVDDQAIIRKIMGVQLGKWGVQTLYAENGLSACEMAIARIPDLVLLDLNIPELDGIEVLKRLQADPRTAKIPVIVASGEGTETRIIEAIDAGASGFVVKPVVPEVLLEKLREFLRS